MFVPGMNDLFANNTIMDFAVDTHMEANVFAVNYISVYVFILYRFECEKKLMICVQW